VALGGPVTAVAGRRGGVVGAAEVVVERVGDRDVVRCRGNGPLTPRQLPGRVLLLGATAGPLGGDVHRLRVVVGPGASLHLGSVAAAVVLPGIGEPAVVEAVVELADGAELRWEPEPTVVVEGADLRATTSVHLAATARLVRVETIVLGRHGEGPGSVRSRIDVVRDGVPVLRHELVLGPGAAVTDHDVFDERLEVGPRVGAATPVVDSATDGWRGRWSTATGVVREVRSRRRPGSRRSPPR
jgi:hypothetical protein